MTENNNVNEELMVQDNTDIVDDYECDYDSEEHSGNGLGKLLVGGIILGTVSAVGAFVYKKIQPKLEERQVENLRKKGYVVMKEDDVEAIVPVDVYEDETETEIEIDGEE